MLVHHLAPTEASLQTPIHLFLLAEQLRLDLNKIGLILIILTWGEKKAANSWYLNIKCVHYVESLISFQENNSQHPKPRKGRLSHPCKQYLVSQGKAHTACFGSHLLQRHPGVYPICLPNRTLVPLKEAARPFKMLHVPAALPRGQAT